MSYSLFKRQYAETVFHLCSYQRYHSPQSEPTENIADSAMLSFYLNFYNVELVYTAKQLPHLKLAEPAIADSSGLSIHTLNRFKG